MKKVLDVDAILIQYPKQVAGYSVIPSTPTQW
jgi:hypothetical protein